jgi:hypothetical protein
MFFDLLVPHCSSPFVELSFSNNSEMFDASHVSSKLFEYPPFQAIVKFKWHAFARFRFYVLFFCYILYLGFFTAAISGTTRSTQLMILSMVMGTTLLIWNYKCDDPYRQTIFVCTFNLLRTFNICPSCCHWVS